MAKVFKMTLYVVDNNDDYEDGEAFEAEIEDSLERAGLMHHIAEVKESEAFEWKDELPINHRDATKEDHEVYFKK